MLAENLLAAMLGLEVASGNDALASHSAIRKTAKLMLQFIPGTDFIFSGYSAVPKRDNLFGGGNFDADDFDDYSVLQRDMQVDGGTAAGDRAASRSPSGARPRWRFRPFTPNWASRPSATTKSRPPSPPTAARTCHARDVVADLEAANRFLKGDQTILAVVGALHRRGFDYVAANLLEMGRQRVAGDYLQPAAIFDRNFHVLSAINDVNDYTGPGTGYRVSGERWQEMQQMPQVKSPRDFIADQMGEPLARLGEMGPARPGAQPEVVVAVGPAFGTALTNTIGGLSTRGRAGRHPHRRGQRRPDRAHCEGLPVVRSGPPSARPARSLAAQASALACSRAAPPSFTKSDCRG